MCLKLIEKFLFALFLWIAFQNPMTVPFILDSCWAAEIDELKLISLDVKDETLGNVLEMIGQTTGYEISIESEVVKLPLTTSFNHLSLHESLRRVLGNLNKYIIIDDIEKKVYLTTVSAGGIIRINDKSRTDFSDISIVPPDKDGDPPITYRDIEKLKGNRIKTDPMDVEIAPPDEPGGKTVTLRDIKRKQYNPLDVEIVPPDDANERGITLREIQN